MLTRFYYASPPSVITSGPLCFRDERGNLRAWSVHHKQGESQIFLLAIDTESGMCVPVSNGLALAPCYVLGVRSNGNLELVVNPCVEYNLDGSSHGSEYCLVIKPHGQSFSTYAEKPSVFPARVQFWADHGPHLSAKTLTDVCSDEDGSIALLRYLDRGVLRRSYRRESWLFRVTIGGDSCLTDVSLLQGSSLFDDQLILYSCSRQLVTDRFLGSCLGHTGTFASLRLFTWDREFLKVFALSDDPPPFSTTPCHEPLPLGGAAIEDCSCLFLGETARMPLWNNLSSPSEYFVYSKP